MGIRDLSLDNESQALYVPKSKPSAKLRTTTMKPILLQTYPLLGQVLCTNDESVEIQAILKVPRAQGREEWEVSLWYSADKSEWSESRFHEVDAGLQPQSLQSPSESTIDIYFTTTVAFKSSVNFTIRFRSESHQAWTWVRDEYGFGDGVVVRSAPPSASTEIPDLIKDLNTAWRAKERVCESPRTRLWSLESTVRCSERDLSSFSTIRIGTPWGSFLRWFALVRHSASWIAPRQGRSHVALDKDAILFSFLGTNGRYLVFLPISGINDTTSVLRYTDREGLLLHARCDAETKDGKSGVSLVVAESESFDCAVAAVMYHARTRMSQESTESTGLEQKKLEQKKEAKAEGEFHAAWIEKWYDGIGYCTWNGLGQELTEEKILHALDSLAENNIDVSSLIIDDNWQSVDSQAADQSQRGWLEFQADRKAFPRGIDGTVKYIRRWHRNIRFVAVWHAMLGYWGGISPNGELAKNYKTVELDRLDPDGKHPEGDKMTVIAKEDVSRFYKDFYEFLDRARVNAVKTDAQFMLDALTSSKARRELSKEYFDAWTLQSTHLFARRVISCMSLFPQALFYSQMRPSRVDCVLRTSDDYFPNEPRSHAWHVWANAHNCIFAQYLNVIPDWDMFQTRHEFGGFHAAARCVSGGPIWITDIPGEYDFDLLQQMTGRTTRGRTAIFRPSNFGKAINPFTGYHDDVLLKVGSYHGGSRNGSPILAIFNVSQRPLAEIIPLSNFPGANPELEYVIRSHVTGRTSSPMELGSPGSFVSGLYDVGGYDILTAIPVRTVPSHKHGSVSVGNFGLLGKMTGSAALTNHNVVQRENNRVYIDTSMKALGTLGLYVSSLRNMDISKDFMITIQGEPIPFHTVNVSTSSEFVLEVDVETAWYELNARSGWSNEVRVAISFST